MDRGMAESLRGVFFPMFALVTVRFSVATFTFSDVVSPQVHLKPLQY
jgi:hypothetical protein